MRPVRKSTSSIRGAPSQRRPARASEQVRRSSGCASARPLVFSYGAMKILAAFEWSFIWDNRVELWDGFKNTMKVSVIGVAGAFVIGLVLGAVRAHRIPVLSQVAWAYVEVIRNTPILVQIFLIYYGLPQLGYQVEGFTVAWLAVMVWGGAFNTENFRAGFEAVPKRFREAGYALGFSPLKTFL